MKRYHVLVVLTFLLCALHTAAASAYRPGKDGPWSREEYGRILRMPHDERRAALAAGRRVGIPAGLETGREVRSQGTAVVAGAAARKATELQDSTLQEALTRLAGGAGTSGDRELRNGLRNERKAGSYAFSSVFTPAIPSASVPALVESLQSRDERVRHSAAFELRFAGFAAKEAVPALLKTLEDLDSDVRWVTVGTLGAIGAGSQQVVPALVRALRDPTAQVRGAAAEALVNILP